MTEMTTKMARATATVSSTVNVELVVDLEEAMMSQGYEDDDTYSKKYKTASKDRTDSGAACAKQKNVRNKRENRRQWSMLKDSCNNRLRKGKNRCQNKPFWQRRRKQ